MREFTGKKMDFARWRPFASCQLATEPRGSLQGSGAQISFERPMLAKRVRLLGSFGSPALASSAGRSSPSWGGLSSTEFDSASHSPASSSLCFTPRSCDDAEDDAGQFECGLASSPLASPCVLGVAARLVFLRICAPDACRAARPVDAFNVFDEACDCRPTELPTYQNVAAYFNQLIGRSGFMDSVAVGAVVLFERAVAALLARGRWTTSCWRQVLLASLILAQKFILDVPLAASSFGELAQVASFSSGDVLLLSKRDVIALELALYLALDCNAGFSHDEYAATAAAVGLYLSDAQ